MSAARQTGILALKGAISLALLAWVFTSSKIHWSDLAWSRHGGLDPLLVLGGAGMVALYLVLAALRLGIVLRAFGFACPATHVLRIALISHALSLVSFGPVAGAASRIVLVLRDHPERKAAATLAVLADHMVGSFAIGLAGVTALLWRASDFARHPVFQQPHVLRAATVAGLLAMAFPFVILFLLGRKNHQPPPGDPAGRLWQWRAMARRMRAKPSSMILGCLVGVPEVLAYFLVFAAGAAMVRVPVRWTDILAAMPVVDLVASLPVSIAGLGVREKAFESMLAALGSVSAADAVSLSLAGFSLLALGAVPGLACLPWHRRLTVHPQPSEST